MDLRIDAEFRSLCPPLSREEYSGLEAKLKAEGCVDPLRFWQDDPAGPSLIDGHNRQTICNDLGIGYKTLGMSFPDRESVVLWIMRNQLGRRNLDPDKASEFRGRIFNAAKAQHGGDRKPARNRQDQDATVASCPETAGIRGVSKAPLEKTATALAEEFGVSERTISNDGAYAAALDKVAPLVQEPTKPAPKPRSEKPAPRPSRKSVIAAAKEVEKNPEKARAILAGKEPVKPAPAEKACDTEKLPIDENGSAIPAHLTDAFAARSLFDESLSMLTQLSGRVNKIFGTERDEGNQFAECISLQELHRGLKNVRTAIKFARPYAVCGYCKGTGKRAGTCKGCKGHGWQTERDWETVPSDLKEVKR